VSTEKSEAQNDYWELSLAGVFRLVQIFGTKNKAAELSIIERILTELQYA